MTKVYLFIMSYGILIVASPIILAAQLLDSFQRAGVDIWSLHNFIQKHLARVK